jgi:hypothetical protein
MSTHPVRTIAAEAARSVGRRLRARRRQGRPPAAAPARTRGHAPAPPAQTPSRLPVAGHVEVLDPVSGHEPQAPDAELDALRGELVRELDRLAADEECSASFRRA